MAKAPRIQDVADVAGVSATTVSHALSGRRHVNPDTRDRVEQAAAKLGYAPNRIASALRRQRTGVIGFVSEEIATTPFAGRIVLGAQDAAADLGLLLMIVNVRRDTITDRQIDALLEQRVDAAVFASFFHRAITVPPRLLEVPTVLVDAFDRRTELLSIVPDEFGIGLAATKHLLAAGHRVIVHLTITEPGPGVEGRTAGYRAAMVAAGLEPRVIAVDFESDAAAGRRAARIAYERWPELTATFCFNDRMAMGVYQLAAETGIARIPDDLSVMGVDDAQLIADEIRPGLTTVRLPHYELGRTAVERVARSLDGEPSAGGQVLIPGRVVERQSIAPARSLPFRDPLVKSGNQPPV